MKPAFLPLLAVAFTALVFSRPAIADAVPVGVITYDYGVNGPNTAEFDIFDATGPNSFDPDFPATNSISLTNLSLLVDFANGTSETFGSSYFALQGDGLSFDGNPMLTTLGAPSGLNGATSATLSGLLSTGNLVLSDGAVDHLQPNFSTTIVGSATGGLLQDGDSALIQVTPEPSSWILAASGLLGLFLIRRRLLPASAPAPNSGRSAAAPLTLAALLVAGSLILVAATPSSAQSIKLGTTTSPGSGASGTSAVNLTGSGFPTGTIPAANVAVTVASSCAGSGSSAPATSVTRITGSTDRVQFVIPASLASGSYFVSLSGTTSTGTAFSSSNCAEVDVTGASPLANLSASAIAFPNASAGASSPTQTVTLSNPGSGTLTISSIALSGPAANLFTESDNCNGSVAAGSYCTITAGFNPKIPASYSATLTLTDNASPATQTVALSGTAAPFAITIDTTNSSDWKINNGALTLDFAPSKSRIFGIHLAGYSDNLVDTTNSSEGIYMDNSGFGSGTTTYGYDNAGPYLDWWVTTASSSTNAYTFSMHFVVYPNDPGIHTYFVANHATTDIAGSIGQVQWVYRSNLTDFPNTYSVNPDLSNPGPIKIPLPLASEDFSTDPGRAVSDATVDLHGFALPAGFTREFYTKYDYSSYNYLHQAHGTYGSTFGTWAYFPSNESLVAGPTKQNLIFTGNLLMIEAYSNHYDNNLALNTPAGKASSRLFGPFYIHFNTFGQAYNATGNAINTPDDMYADTLQAGAAFVPQYDSERDLLQAGYIPSTNRGSVSVQVANVIGAPKTAWAVLSDPGANIQFSSQGYQYWADISTTGTATFNGVAPGTYRLSVYDLGKWGEFRQDGVVVTANQTTTVPAVTFVPENFGGETVFTIGTPDRSSHEFLHGHDAAGHDDREFFGAWNYWADFAANQGAVIYNATAGPAGPATNDLTKWNYNHWGVFDPGLFGGVFSSTDDTTDGYKYVIPSYVASLTGASGTDGVTTRTPPWQIHFATPQDAANYPYAVLSIAMACDDGSYVIKLNSTSRTWSFNNGTDCAVRSGLSGYTRWFALQFPISALNPAGQDNLITLGVSQTYGPMDDALRLELSTTGVLPSVTGWNDYDYLTSSSGTTYANDAVPNP